MMFFWGANLVASSRRRAGPTGSSCASCSCSPAARAHGALAALAALLLMAAGHRPLS
ncbi:hypothetical protein HBB16_18670 [Pseudonocardia sp. MCCB 268]|nr:hypothetical protein [Pseudonocardia cytotoxica]